MDFSTCPECRGEDQDEAGSGTCALCGGSGNRPVTAASIELAISAKEWADEVVEGFFGDWCRLTGKHRAYGVESWSVGCGKLRIVQDTSCRGCYDTESHEFPLAWLLAGPEEREALIRTEMEGKARKEAQAREIRRVEEIGRLRARIADLEAPDSGPAG